MRTRSISALLALTVLGGCEGCEEAPPPAVVERPPDPRVQRLFWMTTGSTADEDVARWSEKITNGVDIDTLADALSRDPRFGSKVLPRLLFAPYLEPASYFAVPFGFVLSQTEPDRAGRSVFYLREPCEAKDAVAVAPWWNLSRKVRVCPDAHRPDKWTLTHEEQDYRADIPLACDSKIGSPELERASVCGCGPNLIRCARDFAQYSELRAALQDEVVKTTAHVFENDLPIQTLFTGEATFRTRNAELLDRRRRIGREQLVEAQPLLVELDRWPRDGKWAPRSSSVEGQHAGLLTAPQLLHLVPDRRQRQRIYYEILWCKSGEGFGATTERVLEVVHSGNLAFEHDSWKRLASMEFCTGCHARMDYGFQFFLGYSDSRASLHYTAAAARPGRGPLYQADIDDLRGEGPLTPAGFADLAVAQPEFDRCMATRIVEHVLADAAEPRHFEEVTRVVEKTHSFQRALAAALKLALASPPAPAPSEDTTEVPSALRAMMKAHCIECHHEETYVDPSRSLGKPFDFLPEQLPRALLLRMADQVAFGKMPKAPNTMNHADRRRFVELLVQHLYAPGDARGEARDYFLGAYRGDAVQGIDQAFGIVEEVARGEADVTWGPLERTTFAPSWTYTPSFAAVTALHALRACQAANKRGEALEACVRDATAPHRFIRGPLR